MTTQPNLRIDEMRALAAQDDLRPFVERAVALHASDLADVLAELDESTRVRAMSELPTEVASRALAEMEPSEHPEELLLAVGPDYAADLVEHLPKDVAADIVAEMEPDDREALLSEIPDRLAVEQLLQYPEDTAGRIMNTAVVAVRTDATLARALDEIRRQSDEGEALYVVYVVDGARRLSGILPIARLVVGSPARRVSEIMEHPTAVVTPDQDQEHVAQLMARYNLAEVPVVDGSGRLLGRVTFDDVIDVVEAETTEDLLQFGGVSPDEDLAAPWTDAVKNRLPWLYVNLLTASLAGAVVYLFQDTVSRVVALAVWMPVIAGMGGNTGTQALAVTVRRLALGRVPRARAREVVAKELLVGAVNGLAIGVVVGVVASLLGEGGALGLVAALAMLGNLAVAGFAGAFIPIVLERVGVDPAIASSVFVTTFTDICGFVLLLGLGTLLLL